MRGSVLFRSIAGMLCVGMTAFFGCGDDPSGPAPDTTAPTFSSSYPKAGAADENGYQILVKLSEPCTTYFVAVPEGANAPTAVQIMNGQDEGFNDLPDGLHGRVFVTAANAEVSMYLVSEGAGETYDVYVIAKDPANNRSVVKNFTLTTADLNPPVFVSAPAQKGVALEVVTIAFTVDEAGTGYAMALPEGATAPTSAEVKAGAGIEEGLWVSGACNAGAEALLELSNLAPSTSYDVYVVVEDAESNLQASPMLVQFTTEAGGKMAKLIAWADESALISINGDSVYRFERYKDSNFGEMSVMLEEGANAITIDFYKYYQMWWSKGELILKLTWNDGADSIISNGSWKYSFNTPAAGWDQPGFSEDETWHQARENNPEPGEDGTYAMQTHHGQFMDSLEYQVLDSTSRWIYSSKDLYYRKSITASAGDQLVIRHGALNGYTLYVNGDSISGHYFHLLARQDTIECVEGENVIAAHVLDTTKGDLGGIFFADGWINDSLVFNTDGTWKSHVEEVLGWNDVDFNDDTWYPVDTLGNYVMQFPDEDGKMRVWLAAGPDNNNNNWWKSLYMYPYPAPFQNLGMSSAQWISAPLRMYFRLEFTVE